MIPALVTRKGTFLDNIGRHTTYKKADGNNN